MMKSCLFFVFVAFQVWSLDSKIIPDYLPPLCAKSVKNYAECSTNTLSEWGPHLVNGIKEINFPKLEPLHIPLFIVNRTLNENVVINFVLRDLKFSGFKDTQLKYFKFDHRSKTGELQLFIPQLRASIEYDTKGKFFEVSLENAGYFKGIANDVDLYFKFQLKKVEQLGVTYFAFDKFVGKSTIGSALVKLDSKDPEFQSAANFLTTFFNEFSKTILETVQPIYDESITYFYKGLAERVLSTVPAHEIIPE